MSQNRRVKGGSNVACAGAAFASSVLRLRCMHGCALRCEGGPRKAIGALPQHPSGQGKLQHHLPPHAALITCPPHAFCYHPRAKDGSHSTSDTQPRTNPTWPGSAATPAAPPCCSRRQSPAHRTARPPPAAAPAALPAAAAGHLQRPVLRAGGTEGCEGVHRPHMHQHLAPQRQLAPQYNLQCIPASTAAWGPTAHSARDA